jgi:hypothetical protein
MVSEPNKSVFVNALLLMLMDQSVDVKLKEGA